MNITERIKMVKAMEFIARQINDEYVFEDWLVLGVGDEDIDYGDLSAEKTNSDLDYYCANKNFSELMGLFLRIMARASKTGGLCCDGIIDDNKN